MASKDEKIEDDYKGITIHKIISAVNPDLYYDATGEDKGLAKKEISEFKDFIKSQGELGIQKGAEKAKPKPLAQHTLVYDSSSETLEPVYFFILDLMNNSFHLNPEKLVDNFISSPGSGHFGDLGQRSTILQQQASRVMGDINNVMRSILNVVYDLKEFKVFLKPYEDLKSGDSAKKESALLSLKQRWMDRVDINKGNSSIKMMTFGGQMGYQTLIDAFLAANDEKKADALDLNDRVKRIVKSRISEFNIWLSESERELKKRYELQRRYLKSQVNSVKLYSRWAKPYLKSIEQLEMRGNPHNAGLVKAFNSMLLELTVLGTLKFDMRSSIENGQLPKELKKSKIRRDYISCIVVDFNFRGIPQKTSPYQQHYVFGGRAEVTFSAYALSADELRIVREQLEKADLGEAMQLIQGATTGSLDEMQKDIDMFLKEEDEEEKKTNPVSDESNPFLALIGAYNPRQKGSSKSEPASDVPLKDSVLEKDYIRPVTADNAKDVAFTIFDVYKKAHGMASFT